MEYDVKISITNSQFEALKVLAEDLNHDGPEDIVSKLLGIGLTTCLEIHRTHALVDGDSVLLLRNKMLHNDLKALLG